MPVGLQRLGARIAFSCVPLVPSFQDLSARSALASASAIAKRGAEHTFAFELDTQVTRTGIEPAISTLIGGNYEPILAAYVSTLNSRGQPACIKQLCST